MFEGHEEFLDQVQSTGDKLGKRMMYERKQQMHKKYLKVPPRWILGIIKRELNLFKLWNNETLDDFYRQHNMALAY
jgi:hypothetical protein